MRPYNFRCIHKLLKSDCYLHKVCKSVCVSVRKISASTRRNLWNKCLRIFLESVQKIQLWLKPKWITGTLQEDRYTFIIPRWILLRFRNVLDKSCTGNQSTHFVFNNFFRRSFHLWDKANKYWTARQATDDSMAYTICILDTWGYRHTFRISINYCFSTATMVRPLCSVAFTLPVLYSLVLKNIWNMRYSARLREKPDW